MRSKLTGRERMQEKLLKQHILLIFGEIDDTAFEKLRDELLYLEGCGSPDIEIRIDSGGGDTLPGYLMYDLIRAYKGKTTGIVLREAMSMASVVLQACIVRKICEHAWVHIHTPSSFGRVTLTDLESPAVLKDLKFGLRKCADDMIAIYARRSLFSPEAIRKVMDADCHLFAAKALELGLVDEII